MKKNRSINENGIYFSTRPLATIGKLAFIYPGSGNHFHGMGRELGQQWPQILDRLDFENDALASQFASGKFWSTPSDAPFSHEEVIFGQVWLGTFVSDVISQFGIRPNAIIGYSLGETAGFFSTRTWTDRDVMLRRIRETDLFDTRKNVSCASAFAISVNCICSMTGSSKCTLFVFIAVFVFATTRDICSFAFI